MRRPLRGLGRAVRAFLGPRGRGVRLLGLILDLWPSPRLRRWLGFWRLLRVLWRMRRS